MKVKIKHNKQYNFLEIGSKTKAKKFRNVENLKYNAYVSFGFTKDKELVYMYIDNISEVSPHLFSEDEEADTNPLFIAFKNWQSKNITFK